MFKNYRLYRKFRKEVDMEMLNTQAIKWTKDYFKKRGVPHWTSEYQNTFGAHVLRYINAYKHTYAKKRLAEFKAQQATTAVEL